MYQKESIGIREAQSAIDVILGDVEQDPDGRGVSIAVVDDQGELIALARMDNARVITGESAVRKAYTSARMRSTSGALTARLTEMDPAIADFVRSDPKLLPIQGGVCIKKPGTDICVGAIAVSGLDAPEDEALSEKGIQAMKLEA